MKTAVIYWSGTGNTEAMARAVAEGMTAAGAEAVLLTPAEVQPGNLVLYNNQRKKSQKQCEKNILVLQVKRESSLSY